MKNLYQDLGLRDAEKNSRVLEDAVARSKDLKSKFIGRFILLNPRRKTVYDRNLHVLKTIARLRDAVSVKPSFDWARLHQGEFDSSAKVGHNSSIVRPLLLFICFVFVGIVIYASYVFDRDTDSVDSAVPAASASDLSDAGKDSVVGASAEFRADQPYIDNATSKQLPSLVGDDLTNSPMTWDELLKGTGITSESSIAPSNLIMQPLPQNGAVVRYSSAEPIAPFSVSTRRGDGNFFVKLADTRSPKKAIVTVFIRDGMTAEIDVPLGTYELKYATGTSWYGAKDLFGSSTRYAKADETFTFRTEGNRVSGYSVELHLQANGNLETDPISADEF